jgi:hypothetical protein
MRDHMMLKYLEGNKFNMTVLDLGPEFPTTIKPHFKFTAHTNQENNKTCPSFYERQTK